MKGKTGLPLFLFVGFVTGGVLALLTHHSVKESLPFVWISFFGSFFLLNYPYSKNNGRLFFTTLIASFFASIPYLSKCYGNYLPLTFSQITLATCSAYAINAFHLHYTQHGFEFSYSTLFRAVWDSVAELIIAFFFTLLCWAILMITAALFRSIDISILSNLLQKSWFDAFISSLFFSTGLWIAIESKISLGIRYFLLFVCQYLLPPLAIISLLFLAGLAIQRTIATSDQLLFLSIGFLGIVFLNGIYQDGTVENPYHKTLWKVVQLFLMLLPIFTLLSLYQTISIGNNALLKTGLTTQNFPYLINVILLFIYTSFYAVIATQTTPWLKGLQKINITLSVVLIVTAILTNNPITRAFIPKPQHPPLFYHDAQHQHNPPSPSPAQNTH